MKRSAASVLFPTLLLPLIAGAAGKNDAPVVKQGKITVVRGFRGPAPQLTDERGRRWLIIGPVRPELLRLGGHTVRVWGKKPLTGLGSSRGARSPIPTFEAVRYEILDSGGHKPLVGRLRGIDKGLVLDVRGRRLVVVGKKPLIKRMRRRVGCKVWIVGRLEEDRLKASKFGWLTCSEENRPTPGSSPGKPKKRSGNR